MREMEGSAFRAFPFGRSRAKSSVRESRDDRRVAVVAIVAACIPCRGLQFRLPTLWGMRGPLCCIPRPWVVVLWFVT